MALARMIDKTLRVTPEKLTGIIEESWDNYIVESEYAKKYFNIQMQSGNTFTADMPTLYIGGRREAFIGEQAFEITETEKGHFSIDATDAQVDAITHVIYTKGINTAGEGAVGLRMYKYKIEGNPFR